MSGIAGCLSLTRRGADARLVERMAHDLTRRGPDDAGTYIAPDERLVLACRRLALIDPSDDARLPMPNERGDIWAAVDGTVLNHRALRHGLELDGHVFRSRSDAETLIHAYEQYGLDFLRHLEGGFAIALWDDRTCRLVLARDRLGERSLYWCRRNDQLVFASTIKAVAASGVARRLDPLGLAQYLTLGHAVPPLTLLDGVCKLGPGELMVVERGGASRTEAWWRPGCNARHATAVRALTPQQQIDTLRTIIETSVADRLTGDAPVGVAIEDTLPSFAVAGAMARLLGRPVEAVALGPISSAGYDTARRMGLSLAAPEPLPPDALADAAGQMDEPLSSPRAMLLWQAARRLRGAGVPAALVADGAEALFGTLVNAPVAPVSWRRRLARLLPAPLRRLADPPSSDEPREDPPPPSALVPERLRHAVQFWPVDEALEALQAGMPPWIALEQAASVAYRRLRWTAAEHTLACAEKMGLAHGVALRLPYLDRQLADFALAMPQAARPGQGALLPMVFPDLAVGTEPSPQPPADLAAAAGAALAEACDRSALFRHGILDRGSALLLLQAFRRSPGPHLDAAWTVASLAWWYDGLGLDGLGGFMPGMPLRADVAE